MTDRNPCGKTHPLPCGLDKVCPVPVECFETDKSDQEIVTDYED